MIRPAHIAIGSALLVVVYLTLSLIDGDRGFRALQYQAISHDLLAAELSRISDENDRLQARIRALHGPVIDADLFDETARRVLGYAGIKETIIVLPPPLKVPITDSLLDTLHLHGAVSASNGAQQSRTLFDDIMERATHYSDLLLKGLAPGDTSH